MSNPEALAAISQIQSGLQRLQTAAPELYTSMGMPNLAAGMNFGRNTTASTSTSSTPSTTTSSSNSTNTTTTPAGQGQNMDSFRQLMNSMVTGMANQGLNAPGAPPPEERFRSQLETLASMGFVDRQANIQGRQLYNLKTYNYTSSSPLNFPRYEAIGAQLYYKTKNWPSHFLSKLTSE